MADTLTAEQRAFQSIHNEGDLVAGVQLARRVMQGHLLVRGIDEDANTLAELLAGQITRDPARGVEWDSHCAQMYAALVLGIAMGQLVHPDVFAKASTTTRKAGAR